MIDHKRSVSTFVISLFKKLHGLRTRVAVDAHVPLTTYTIRVLLGCNCCNGARFFGYFLWCRPWARARRRGDRRAHRSLPYMMHQNPFMIIPTLSLFCLAEVRAFGCAEAQLRSSWHPPPLLPQASLRPRPFLRLRYVQSSNDDDDDDGAYTSHLYIVTTAPPLAPHHLVTWHQNQQRPPLALAAPSFCRSKCQMFK
jgi:hypothetical protein